MTRMGVGWSTLISQLVLGCRSPAPPHTAQKETCYASVCSEKELHDVREPPTHPSIHLSIPPGPNASPPRAPPAPPWMPITPAGADVCAPTDRLPRALAERGPEDPLCGAARVPRQGAEAAFLLVLLQRQLVHETLDSASAQLGASPLPGQESGARGSAAGGLSCPPHPSRAMRAQPCHCSRAPARSPARCLQPARSQNAATQVYFSSLQGKSKSNIQVGQMLA